MNIPCDRTCGSSHIHNSCLLTALKNAVICHQDSSDPRPATSRECPKAEFPITRAKNFSQRITQPAVATQPARARDSDFWLERSLVALPTARPTTRAIASHATRPAARTKPLTTQTPASVVVVTLPTSLAIPLLSQNSTTPVSTHRLQRRLPRDLAVILPAARVALWCCDEFEHAVAEVCAKLHQQAFNWF